MLIASYSPTVCQAVLSTKERLLKTDRIHQSTQGTHSSIRNGGMQTFCIKIRFLLGDECGHCALGVGVYMEKCVHRGDLKAHADDLMELPQCSFVPWSSVERTGIIYSLHDPISC